SRKHAHVPDCFDVEVGNWVKVAECRPLSKNVAMVVIQVSRSSTEKGA
ncbi:MAG: 30S ribosomal protein S17, partial [Candidatus Thorarchaeota archaeon]